MHTIVHRIRTGTELDLPLAEGSELFCREGALRLTAAPQAWAYGMPPVTIVLFPGQGWRAGETMHLRVSALSTACLELQAAPAQQGLGLPRLQMAQSAGRALAGWLRGFRRGRHAA